MHLIHDFFALPFSNDWPAVYNQWLKHYLKWQPSLKTISLATRWKKTNFSQRKMNNTEFSPAVETRLMTEACLALSGSAIQPPQNLVECNCILVCSQGGLCIYMRLKIYTAIWTFQSTVLLLHHGLHSVTRITHIPLSVTDTKPSLANIFPIYGNPVCLILSTTFEFLGLSTPDSSFHFVVLVYFKTCRNTANFIPLHTDHVIRIFTKHYDDNVFWLKHLGSYTTVNLA